MRDISSRVRSNVYLGMRTDEYVYDENYDFKNCATRVVSDAGFHDEDVIQAIWHTLGNYSAMSELLARRRSSVRDYVLSHPSVKLVFDEVRESFLDRVESNVFKQADEGDASQCRFILQTLGKSRGYSTRQELTGEDGKPLRLITAEMTPEEAAEAYADSL